MWGKYNSVATREYYRRPVGYAVPVGLDYMRGGALNRSGIKTQSRQGAIKPSPVLYVVSFYKQNCPQRPKAP